MFCINCFHKNTQVVNSRPHKKQPSVWRRRRCLQCHQLFTTYERPSLADNKLIHLDNGLTDTFNLGRLILSVGRSFLHNPREAQTSSLWLAQTIEDTLSTEYTSITPADIGAVTHQTLKRYDELAAMQYAAQHELLTSIRLKSRIGRPSLRGRERPSDASPSQ